jgi:hypothetical protein
MEPFFKIYTLLFMRTSNFKLFAGTKPGYASEGSELESNETAKASFSKWMTLVIMGLLLVFNKFQKLSKNNNPILIIASK